MSNKHGEVTNLGQCVRYFLIVVNFFILLMSLAMIGVGIWLIVDRDFLTPTMDIQLFRTGIYMILISGVVLFAVFFCGCMGAVMLKRPFLLIFFIVLLIITTILFVAGILAIVMRSKLQEEIKRRMMDSLRLRYGVKLEIQHNKDITYGFDRAQELLRCCAVDDNGWNNYRESQWFYTQPGQVGNVKAYVPKSCCLKKQNSNEYDEHQLKQCQSPDRGPPRDDDNIPNPYLFTKGCYTRAVEFLKEHLIFIMAFGFGVAITLILAIILSMVLYCSLEY